MHSQRGKKSQAAFEYLVTYGWAILAAIIAIGALSYFGFISPSNLLPNKCNFGRQLECTDFQITSDGDVRLMMRNNFGKPIQILDIAMSDDGAGITGSHPFSIPISISSGGVNETLLILDPKYHRPAGEKQTINLEINFTRTDVSTPPSHIVRGYVFVTVSTPG